MSHVPSHNHVLLKPGEVGILIELDNESLNSMLALYDVTGSLLTVYHESKDSFWWQSAEDLKSQLAATRRFFEDQGQRVRLFRSDHQTTKLNELMTSDHTFPHSSCPHRHWTQHALEEGVGEIFLYWVARNAKELDSGEDMTALNLAPNLAFDSSPPLCDLSIKMPFTSWESKATSATATPGDFEVPAITREVRPLFAPLLMGALEERNPGQVDFGANQTTRLETSQTSANKTLSFSEWVRHTNNQTLPGAPEKL